MLLRTFLPPRHVPSRLSAVLVGRDGPSFVARPPVTLRRQQTTESSQTAGQPGAPPGPSPPYLHCRAPEIEAACRRNMLVREDFITEREELELLKEVEPSLKRLLRYEYDHWDDAIHGYREIERSGWSEPSQLILQRVRQVAFPPGVSPLHLVHVLDLAGNGWIKPHVDSVKFAGNTIAGLSLLSPSVMRLVHNNNKHWVADVLLKPRSLYIMRDAIRYDFTHEILKADQSKFRGEVVPRDRRISVICRNEPPPMGG